MMCCVVLNPRIRQWARPLQIILLGHYLLTCPILNYSLNVLKLHVLYLIFYQNIIFSAKLEVSILFQLTTMDPFRCQTLSYP
jgi:hypothetical protein